ncbi:MAG: Com family DNA-binding transcriptional regulator [Proteobacteria bacterium]|nr:Com family DNA-binding transcriptional regulator [Pseudomonadota bacterium]
MREIRCRKCKRLLMRGNIMHIEIKCPKCGYTQNFMSSGIPGKESLRSKRKMDAHFRGPP